jgi:hypothetical protein
MQTIDMADRAVPSRRLSCSSLPGALVCWMWVLRCLLYVHIPCISFSGSADLTEQTSLMCLLLVVRRMLEDVGALVMPVL